MARKYQLSSLLLLALSLGVTACSEDNTPKAPTDVSEVSEEAMDLMVATYVDRVVLPTYAEMEVRVGALQKAVIEFSEERTQETLDRACDAWRAARKPWEQSEAFLFGPADYESLDPSLDSWPLDKDGIDQILKSQSWDQISGDSEEAQSLRGFHTIEYLLFDEGKNKQLDVITENEIAYMSRVSKQLLLDTERLHKAWRSGLGSDEVPIAFGEELKKHESSRFPSVEKVIGEIIDGGIINIASEVGDVKIGNPHHLWLSGKKVDAVLQVESWYSWNSLTDYEDNIISIENSYLGGIRDDRDEETSLSALVRSVDPELDEEAKQAIAHAIETIRGIPAPFRSHLDKKEEIEAAQDACAAISRVFEQTKTALNLN